MNLENLASVVAAVVALFLSVTMLLRRDSFSISITEYWGWPPEEARRVSRILMAIAIGGIILAGWGLIDSLLGLAS